MSSRILSGRKLGSIVLVVAVIATGGLLAAWKHSALENADAAAANQPEPVEAVQAAIAQQREYRPVTTAIGTVVATRSISVRNELPGTVRYVDLTPGQVVEQGTVLVALDVAVEQAELKALEAQAELAKTQFARVTKLSEQRAVSAEEVDSTRAARDVALAQIARIKATIDRKTIRAPFRARVGISDVHPGQYLSEGTYLTSLQGVDESAYIDFAVAQQIAAGLRSGEKVQLLTGGTDPVVATIMATDSRVDPSTRNAAVRAKVADAKLAPPPGASVRVQVPAGITRLAVSIPASALRKGPGGDFVFVVAQDKDKYQDSKPRARQRPVQVEALAGDEVLIRDGLVAGEQVATSGSFKLRDAVLVSVVPKPESVAANSGTAPAVAL
jgi:membrane fusion protein (multidrug efflux system)